MSFPFRPVKAKLHDRDMIFKHAAVAADNAECSKAGSDALKDGGSAVDAAVASLLCLGKMPSITSYSLKAKQQSSANNSLQLYSWHGIF